LDGKNRGSLPWHLSAQLPEVVEPLVVAENWVSFAQAVNHAATVPKRGVLLETILSFFYPPFASICSFWFARHRARRLRRCIQLFTEGNGESAPFWRRLSARAPAGELKVLFGCDDSATLGHLDFLDTSRSRLDWAPGDLRQECRLLVAHGDGSYMDPLMLDMSDPLVAHLSQSDFGSVAVCSVISTFNRVARTMKSEELTISGPQPTIARLRQKVEQCAAQCGLEGFVKVLVIQQHAPWQSESSSRRSAGRSIMDLSGVSFSDLMRRSGVQGRRPVAGAAVISPSPPPTSELLTGLSSQRHSQTIDVPSEAAADHSVTTPSDSTPPVQPTDVKLCLAFVDFAMLAEFWPPAPAVSSVSSGSNGVVHRAAFTSPMSHKGLLHFMEQNCPPRLEVVGEAEVLDPAIRQPSRQPSRQSSRQPSRLVSRQPSRQPSRWSSLLARESEGSTTPMTVLLVTVVLYALDLLSFVIAGAMFYQLSFSVSLLWMLVPPLTQLLAIAIGPIFMISERPRYGRLFASFTACGIVSILIATCTLMAQQQDDSVVFNLLGLLMVCSIKASLFVSVNMHVGNLEASFDLSFMDAPQGNFIEGVLAADPPQRENGVFDVCENEPGPSTNHGNRWHLSNDFEDRDSLSKRIRSMSDQGTFRPPRERTISSTTPSHRTGNSDLEASPF